MHSLEQVARWKDSLSVVPHDPIMNQVDLLNLRRQLVFLVLLDFRVLLPGLRLGAGAVARTRGGCAARLFVVPVVRPKLFGFSLIEFLIRRGRGLVGLIRATH